MAEEAANPNRDVPRAINMVLVTVLVVYVGMALVSLSAMPVGSNVLPVDETTGKTVPVQVVKSSPEGAYALAADLSQTAFLPVQAEDGGYVIPAQEPGPETFRRDGQLFTRKYGSQLGSNYLEDPVQGVVSFMPDSLAWLRSVLKP